MPGCRYATRNPATRLRLQVGGVGHRDQCAEPVPLHAEGSMGRGVRKCYLNAGDPGVPECGMQAARREPRAEKSDEGTMDMLAC